MKITVQEIEAKSKAALIAHGAADMQAGHVARAVARAEALGNVICGLYYLESYCTQLASGRVSGTVLPNCEQAARRRCEIGRAIRLCAARLCRRSCASCRSRPRQWHRELCRCQRAYLHLAGLFHRTDCCPRADRDRHDQCLAGRGPPGRQYSRDRHQPHCHDRAGGKVRRAALRFLDLCRGLGQDHDGKGRRPAIPLGWAVDADGKPTTDPEAALKGALVSAGGYKGWGFGLMVELLAAGMTGSVNSLDVKGLKLPDGPPHGLGQFYILLDPTTYGDHFNDRFARVAEAVAAQDGARIPGAEAAM